MSYYRIFGLNKEPFSTSPDPNFFYESRSHKAVFYKVRVAVELRRGLSLILGDVGVGKTTLLRKLYSVFSQEKNFVTKIILDPGAKSEHSFFSLLADAFNLKTQGPATANYKKSIENFLFEYGLRRNKIIILFIDEAQKISSSSMEILRLLLNYETNEFKLIQIVLLGQVELLSKISKIKNLWDRIVCKYMINPLGCNEIKQLIEFRLKQAGYSSSHPIFTDDAVDEIYSYSYGYPRKINMLCHDALEYLVKYGNHAVNKEVIQYVIRDYVRNNCQAPEGKGEVSSFSSLTHAT